MTVSDTHADTIREALGMAARMGPVTESEYVIPASTALDALVADLDRLAMKADCGGTNCGKCQQCLTVHEYFLKEAVTKLMRVARAALSANQAVVETIDRWDANIGQPPDPPNAEDVLFGIRAALSAGSGGREPTCPR